VMMIFLVLDLLFSMRDMASSASTRARSAASSASSLLMTTVGGWPDGPAARGFLTGGMMFGEDISMCYIIYYMMQVEKLAVIAKWLGGGSVNVFGLPMSGKDTVGERLAGALHGRFLSSGAILRERQVKEADTGELVPTDLFREVVLPYFYREELAGTPLMLSSVGRWSGEEDDVMRVAELCDHPLRAVLLLDVSEADVWERWEVAQILADRGGRADDGSREIFARRLAEFREKTAPVILHYERLGLLEHVRADGSRDEVFGNAVEALLRKAR